MPNRGLTERIRADDPGALIQSKLLDIKKKVLNIIPTDDVDDVIQDAALAYFVEAKKSRNLARADTCINRAIETAVRRITKHATHLVPLEECCETDEIPIDRIAGQMEITKVLPMLPNREQSLLILRYGLGSGRTFSSNANDFNMTQDEVGLEFGIGRTRVEQIESKALRRLRHPSRARHFREIDF